LPLLTCSGGDSGLAEELDYNEEMDNTEHPSSPPDSELHDTCTYLYNNIVHTRIAWVNFGATLYS